jgi:hypothetical protein
MCVFVFNTIYIVLKIEDNSTYNVNIIQQKWIINGLALY